MLTEPHREQAGERIAVPIPVSLVGEVGAERFRQCGNNFRGARDLRQVTEMAAGQRDDHERYVVAAGEVLTVLAVDRVAEPFALRPVHHCLGEKAEIAGRGQGDVLQRKTDPAALPGGVPMPQCGDNPERGVEPARHVPGRQHVVDRGGMVGGPRHQGEPGGGVDGVVDAGGAVRAAGHFEMDQVGSLFCQGVIRMPFPSNGIRHQDATSGTALDDQALDQALTLR